VVAGLLGSREREKESDRELREIASWEPAEGRFGSEGASRWVRERRSAGRWAPVVGRSLSGRWAPVGRSLSGRWAPVRRLERKSWEPAEDGAGQRWAVVGRSLGVGQSLGGGDGGGRG
jgi:hypothetical protein